MKRRSATKTDHLRGYDWPSQFAEFRRRTVSFVPVKVDSGLLQKGITFTIPDVFWPVFRDNPHLPRALQALAATLIQPREDAPNGSRIRVMDILHTFNGKLEFNPLIHSLVTAGGLQDSTCTWVPSIYYDRDEMIRAWRRTGTGWRSERCEGRNPVP
jgi:hypothetical protein